MDNDIDVIEEELGESIEAADAVLEKSETEVGELLPSFTADFVGSMAWSEWSSSCRSLISSW